jgi:hypothetical protein
MRHRDSGLIMAASGEDSLPLSFQNVGGILDKLTLRRLDVNERFKESCHGCCLRAPWRVFLGAVACNIVLRAL